MAGYQGKQGRKPKPTALKLLQGNPGKRPLNQDEPKAELKIPTPPRELSLRAKREWRALGKQLLSAGLVTPLDRMALSALVQSWSRWLEAQDALSKTGLLVRGKLGELRLNPLLRVSNEAQAEYTRMLTEFGLSPASRSRIHVEKPAEVDEFEELLQRRKS